MGCDLWGPGGTAEAISGYTDDNGRRDPAGRRRRRDPTRPGQHPVPAQWGALRRLADSYHCARLNISTGKFSAAVFEYVCPITQYLDPRGTDHRSQPERCQNYPMSSYSNGTGHDVPRSNRPPCHGRRYPDFVGCFGQRACPPARRRPARRFTAARQASAGRPATAWLAYLAFWDERLAQPFREGRERSPLRPGAFRFCRRPSSRVCQSEAVWRGRLSERR